MLARSKLNSIEGKISEALINYEISHEDFMTIINEERNYRELKKSIRIMNSQTSDTEEINPIEEGKNLKYETMSSYCLKCKKNTENTNPRVSKTNNGKIIILSNML